MSRLKRYWLCQIIGWGSFLLLQIFVAYQYTPDIYLKPLLKRNLFFYTLLIDFFCFIGSTHLLRYALKKLNWISLSPEKVVLIFVFGITAASTLEFYSSTLLTDIPGLSLDKYEIAERKDKAITMEKDLGLANTTYYLYDVGGVKDSTKFSKFSKIKKSTSWYRDAAGNWQFEEQRKGQKFGGFFGTTILIALWLLIYFVWHYVAKNRKDQLDKLKLEAAVKSLELKTIKSHINPHFIFNALNSIRALVDENPERARTAITELSNILRSSLKAETLETVPLQQELEIVKDYLALEHMRFEERLQIEMDISKDTLTQPVPPMMLQTLVENAIKHGISKHENGGVIKIKSYFNNNNLELIVQNTGAVIAVDETLVPGFGIRSTQERLNLLYHNKAHFLMENIENKFVQCTITMPKV